MKKLLLAIIALITFASPALAAEKESAFDRVVNTKTIRCGYAPVGLAIVKDPNTGAISGTAYDVMEEVGKALGFKIEWAEEVTFGTAIAGLQAGRYDVFCSNLYARPNWMPNAELSAPYYHVPVNAYARADEKRFTSRESINKPEIKVAYQDGTVPAFIKKNDFPQAGELPLVDMEYSDLLMAVATGKADITFVEPSVAEEFMANNPGKLAAVKSVSPLYVFPIILAMNKGEHDLNSMLSGTINYLIQSGSIDKIIKKHEKYPNIFWPVAPAYIDPSRKN